MHKTHVQASIDEVNARLKEAWAKITLRQFIWETVRHPVVTVRAIRDGIANGKARSAHAKMLDDYAPYLSKHDLN